MSDVYLLGNDPKATRLKRVRCKDEDKELQTLLLNNFDLLPSKQIDAADPPRWLLVKREMPVPDPASGQERWSIDFLFVDHLAVPTLVECKRCGDTRSRREVVAQMLEYAANGHHYWTGSELARLAADAAGGSEALTKWLQETRGTLKTIEEFFAAVEANLRESRMRLIFFLEESPNELRSLVDFLNKQLNATEVYLVEARIYESAAGRIVVPWLFGYTEQARVAKRESRAEVVRIGGERGEEAYLQALTQAVVDVESRAACELVLDSFPHIQDANAHWYWGVNAILVIPPLLPRRGLCALNRNGDLELYFGYWNATEYKDIGPEQVSAVNRFAKGLEQLLGITFSDAQRAKFPKIKLAQWAPRAAELIALLRSVTETGDEPALADLSAGSLYDGGSVGEAGSNAPA